MELYLGTVVLFAGGYAPVDFAICDGSMLNIQQYAALYAVIGISFGGNGSSTFALPDLRNRVAVGGNSATAIGNAGHAYPAIGTQATQPATAAVSANLTGVTAGSITIGVANLPAHTHTAGSGSISVAIPASGSAADSTGTLPGPGSVLGVLADGNGAATPEIYAPVAKATTTLAPFNVPFTGTTTGSTGSGTSIPINLTGGTVSIPLQLSYTCLNYIICMQGTFPIRN